MPQSVKIADEIMAFARSEAERQSRSVAGQLAHWARIGRAVEMSGQFDHARIAAALDASLLPEELSEEEAAVWLDRLTEAMARPGPDEAAHHARRDAAGLGVGLNAAGRITRAGS